VIMNCDAPSVPTLETWLEWRASLQAVPDFGEISHPRGTKDAMRAALAEVQSHLCAVCLTMDQSMVLDHDHLSGLARGMLCRACNVREGHDGSLLFWHLTHADIITAYRANPPAIAAGWIWDGSGAVGRIMLQRARAQKGARSGFSTVADPDLRGHSEVVGRYLDHLTNAQAVSALQGVELPELEA
jgi:hypothetical protein